MTASQRAPPEHPASSLTKGAAIQPRQQVESAVGKFMHNHNGGHAYHTSLSNYIKLRTCKICPYPTKILELIFQQCECSLVRMLHLHIGFQACRC